MARREWLEGRLSRPRPERGIVAGQRWKEALQQAASRCEVVLALVSAEWLASSYCKAEINTAQMMGKKTIIALIDKSQVPGDLTDEQFIDLSGDPAGLSTPQKRVGTRWPRPHELSLRARAPPLSWICVFRRAGRRCLFRR